MRTTPVPKGLVVRFCHGYTIAANAAECWVSGPFGCVAKFTADGAAVFGRMYRAWERVDFETWVDWTEHLLAEFGLSLDADCRPTCLF